MAIKVDLHHACFVFAGVAFLNAGAALALEDSATLVGRFDWIVDEQIEDQYSDQVLDPGRQHLIPEIKVEKQADGLFRMEVTLPPSLAAGKTLKAVYQQVDSGDEEVMRFENVERSDDYILCDGTAQSWSYIDCDDVTLKGLQKVDREERQAFVQNRYGNSSAAQGMSLAARYVAGAEPAGSMEFYDVSESPYANWIGKWEVQYTTPRGDVVNAIMEIDGFAGVYRPVSGNARGVISRLNFEDGYLSGHWEMNGNRGWFGFNLSGDSFSGDWGMRDDDGGGTWSGRKL